MTMQAARLAVVDSVCGAGLNGAGAAATGEPAWRLVPGDAVSCGYRWRAMNRSEDAGSPTGQLAPDWCEARARIDAARARAVAAAHAAAEAQEQAAVSMERVADLGGPSATLLRHMSIAARQRAVRRHRWASDHAGGAVPARRDGVADRIVVRERDRIAAQLQDTVVRRVFAASLTLHGAAGLSAEPEVRSRIEVTIDELDQVIREIRQVVFAAGHHAHGSAPEILDLGGLLAPAADICFTGPRGSGLDPEAGARLRERLYQALALISEYATPVRVDIVAAGSAHELVIQAACLLSAGRAGEDSRWLADVQARAARAGIRVDIWPESGIIRLGSLIPGGAPQ
jgi:hypothetical protein